MIDTKILILKEKNVIVTKPIKNVLRNHGYEVVDETCISHEVEKTIHKSSPNIILLYTSEKEQLSVEGCFKIKEYSKKIGAKILTIVHNNQQKKKILMEADIDDYLVEPFDDHELIYKIKKLEKAVKLQKKLEQSNQALEESISTIKKQRKELDINLSLAGKIQEALIPKTIGNIPNCSFEWNFQPSGRVGGDIFDVFMLDEEHMGLYMIDVMGHGMASSMLAVALSEFLIIDVDRGSPLKKKKATPPYYEIVSPKEVINYLNKRFPYAKYKHYFTIFYMIMNVKTGEVNYVRAAHPEPILIKNSGETTVLDAYGTPVGFEFSEDYEEKTLYLDSGDSLMIYTDGLLELEDKNGQVFEQENLIKYLQKQMTENSYHLTSELNQMARKNLLTDDLTILEMKWVKFI
ncbi:SpoIIE family protein phosphatase [Serpentinicella sp. ANB-PHB4]|uniref:SpoIIE family protein phosphatase n=1 Tax=Serpentinicella sp. ANB-PHB4 TaxID=3074076 RepID=UPI0028559D8B|nr:SpoIIE family protein phosphatase [Serpentinicella sp. ANB-PHB4]MDR5659897.1 SpoIIE family protein phosphatase [Serpentinicella sp. ANB-PHB4]